jgi:hypothetical protein
VGSLVSYQINKHVMSINKNELRKRVREFLREGSANSLSNEVEEAIRQELSRQFDPASFEIEVKGNQIKVKSDARQLVFEFLQSALIEMGFTHDRLHGGSLGRLVGRRGKEAAYIVFKPLSSEGRASSMGFDYEQALASAINSVSPNVSAKTAGFGHGSDLEITGPKDVLKIEVKTSLGADFGQFSMAYSIDAKVWEPIQTSGFKQHALIFEPIAASLMSNLPPIPDEILQMPGIAIRNGLVTGLSPNEDNVATRAQLQQALFGGSNDLRINVEMANIANYYADKGDQFIQVKGKGLYSLTGKQIPQHTVPLFSDSGLIAGVRFRVKPGQGALGAHRFVAALSIKGTLTKSPVDLDDSAISAKIVSMLEGTNREEQLIREAIRNQLREYAGLRDLVSVICRMQVKTRDDDDPSVPDVLTMLRAAEGVVVVKQLGAIRRAKRGSEMLDVEVKYMPATKDPVIFLDELGKIIKAQHGVKMVRLLTLGGHATTKADGTHWVF